MKTESIWRINDLYSPEIYTLRDWGEAGVDCTDNSGKFDMNEEQFEKYNDADSHLGRGLAETWVGFPLYPGDYTLNGNFTTATRLPQFQAYLYDETDKEFVTAYGVTKFTDLFKPYVSSYGYGWSVAMPADSNIGITKTRMDEMKRQYVPQLIMTKPDQFEGIWKKYTDGLTKLDINEVAKFVTDELNAREAEGRSQ